MATATAPDHVLDCRGTFCPMPVIRLREAIDKIGAGEVIKIVATDPASLHDMPAFARNTGHELIESATADGVFEYLFRKAP